MDDDSRDRDGPRPTIVGGRPEDPTSSSAPIPKTIEVLLKKAAVDATFRERLLDQRGAAAESLGLELDGDERALLEIVPVEQLAQVIANTAVSNHERAVFEGDDGQAMRELLTPNPVPDVLLPSQGIRPDQIRPVDAVSRGIGADLPIPIPVHGPLGVVLWLLIVATFVGLGALLIWWLLV